MTPQKVLAFIWIMWQATFIECSDNETLLINHLLDRYQPYSRPVADPSLPLSLNITLTLKQIIDLDERNQLLKTNLWLEYYWFDHKLQWNPVNLACNNNNSAFFLSTLSIIYIYIYIY